jgi:hypothetical protein
MCGFCEKQLESGAVVFSEKFQVLSGVTGSFLGEIWAIVTKM